MMPALITVGAVAVLMIVGGVIAIWEGLRGRG